MKTLVTDKQSMLEHISKLTGGVPDYAKEILALADPTLDIEKADRLGKEAKAKSEPFS